MVCFIVIPHGFMRFSDYLVSRQNHPQYAKREVKSFEAAEAAQSIVFAAVRQPSQADQKLYTL